jgi:5'-methylthioadenosine phosphorylase
MHDGGTYVCMEGPQFSTRAESELYRSWGATVIGMTNLTEARLAREAELCYATLALVTDYDCWHESEEEVSVESVIANLQANAESAARLLRLALEWIPAERKRCGCGEALQNAILTAPDQIPEETRARLELLVRHRLPGGSG